MKDQARRSQFYALFSELVLFTKVIVSEFEKIYMDENLQKTLPLGKVVYLHAAWINLGKIFSTSPNEKFKLKSFCDISESDIKGIDQIKQQIDEIEIRHQSMITKINKNRNWIFAHIDPRFQDLLFSPAEIAIREKEFNTDFSKILAKDTDNERYSPIDLKNDLAIIRSLLEEVDNIWKEVMMLDYKQNET